MPWHQLLGVLLLLFAGKSGTSSSAQFCVVGINISPPLDRSICGYGLVLAPKTADQNKKNPSTCSLWNRFNRTGHFAPRWCFESCDFLYSWLAQRGPWGTTLTTSFSLCSAARSGLNTLISKTTLVLSWDVLSLKQGHVGSCVGFLWIIKD